MADIDRVVQLYKLPAVVREVFEPNRLARPFTTGSGTVVGGVVGSTTIELGLRTGNVIQQVAAPGVEVATTLKSIKLTIENVNRVAAVSELEFTVLLPGDTVVAGSPYFGDVNAWIADEIAASGATELKSLDAAGWQVAYRGNEEEGNLVLTVPGDQADIATGAIKDAADSAVVVMPAGQWFITVELIAWDDTDNYFWGGGVNDVARVQKYFVPELRDLSCDGKNQQVMVVARGADTTSGLDYVASYDGLGPEGAVAMDGEDVDNGVIGGPNFTGDTALARAQAEAINPYNNQVDSVKVKALFGDLYAILDASPTYTGSEGETVIVDVPGGVKEICVWSDNASAWVCSTLT